MAKDEFWKQDAPAGNEGVEFWKADRNAAQRDLPEGVTPSTAGAGRGNLSLEAYQRPTSSPQSADPWMDRATLGDVGPSGSVLEGRQLYTPESFDFKATSPARRKADDAAATFEERIKQHGSMGPIVGPKASASSIVKGVATDLVASGKGARAGINQMAADLTGSDHFAEQARRERGQADLMTAVNTPEFESETARGLYAGLSSTIRQAPSLAAAILTRNPNLALTGMVAPMLPDEYGKFRQRGATPGQALPAAIGMTTTEYLTEKMPMGVLVNKFGKAGAAQFMGELLAKEIPGEQVATFVQDAIDTATANPDKTWGDYLAERPGAAYQTLLATVTQTGIMGGANAGARKVDQHLKARDLASAIREDAADMPVPQDRTEQIKSLRQSGDTTAADLLQRRQDRETSVYKAEQESQSLSHFGPEIQQHYKTIRMTGVMPGDAVTHAAARSTFEVAAQLANLSPKAMEATLKAMDSVPAEKVPGFVEKAIKGLTARGLAQPFEGIDTIASTIDAQREQLLDAVLSGDIRPTMKDDQTNEGQQNATQETPSPAITTNDLSAAATAPVGEVASLGSDQPGAVDALSSEWQKFPEQTGTLNVPRSEMPQVKTVHRGPMVNFLNARGVTHEQVEVDPADLKPTQAEFSQTKVQEAADRDTDRSILISSDGHIIDGHHQAIAKLQNGKPVRAIRLGATAEELIPLVREFPSSTIDQATDVQNTPQGTAGTEAQAQANQAPQAMGGESASAAAGVPAAGSTTLEAAGVIPQPAQQQQAKAPQHLGVDNVPLTEGGKPFKSKDAAAKAKKLQPMMRVVKVDGGFGLTEKTPAQLAAQEQAAKRLGGVGRGPMSAHAFIASNGGLSRAVASDLGVEGNVRVGGRWLYASNGGMTIEQATEKLKGAGYINEDSHNAAFDIIRRSIQTPQYTAQGWEQLAQAEQEARFEDYLKAQEEGGGNPFDTLRDAGHEEADLANTDFPTATPELLAEVSALRSQLEASDLDVDSILERLALQYPDLPEEQFNERLQAAYQQALSERTEPGGVQAVGPVDDSQTQASGIAGQGKDPKSGTNERLIIEDRADGTLSVQGDKQALRDRLIAAGIPAKSILPASTGVVVGRTQAQKAREVLEGPVLTAPTPEEIVARQGAAEAAQREAEAADRAAQRQADQVEERKRIAQASVGAADTFELGQDPMANLTGQRDIFSASAEPETTKDSGAEIPVNESRSAPSTKPIEDAGQKIGGARKDRWKERGLNLDDLDSMTEAEGAELATKANVWKPDYETLAEASEPVTAAMVKVIYDRLAAKPGKNTPDGRRQYVQMMRIVREVYTEAKGPEAVRNAYLEVRKRAGLNTMDPQAKADARALLFSVYKGRSDPFTMDYSDLSKAKKMVEDGFPAKGEPWRSRLVVGRPQGGPGITERGIELYMEESAALGTPLTREQIEAGFFRVLDKKNKAVAFAPTKADAEAAAKTVYERDMKGGKDSKPEPERPHLDELKRENLPKRIDRDVTTEDFIKDLGFRGVEFGNWSAQDERQRIINMAYDGLMDLAEIMGVPPKAMSLNGSLGMAFGARGGGRFLAHYEPGKLVINMTKLRGGGSMAHEWAHAMDHYFGELDTPDAYTTQARGASGWMAEDQYSGIPRKRMEQIDGQWKSVEKTRLANLRPEMARASDEVMRALFQKQITKAEMVRSQELDLERTEALVRKEQDTEMKAMYERMATNKRQALEELRKDPDDKMYTGRGRSDYASQAQALSGKSEKGYWTRPTEMFARAFESWVFDRVTAMGAKSDYLVHGVEADRFAGGDYKGNPYPTGEERARINAAFEKLVKTIKTKETDKGVAIYSTSDRSVPLAPSHWIDVGVIAKEVENRIGQFAHQPTVRIRDSAFGNLPGVDRNSDAISGAVHKGAIYLFRDQLGSLGEVQRTLFHELLHYGLRKMFSKAQFIEEMHKLASRDASIRREAERWSATEDGRRAAQFDGEDYALARGVDEALALLAEPNAGAFVRTDVLSQAVVRVSKWLADLAEKLGFKKLAAEIRGYKNQEARELIQQVFRRMETQKNPEREGWMDEADAAYQRSSTKDQTKTEAFFRWFSNSKVVKSNGEPWVMYHGTNKNEGGDAFTSFDTYGSNYGLMGQGSYFTAEPMIASEYARKGRGDAPTVYPVYLSIQNPIDMDANANADAWRAQFPDAEAFHEGGDTNESWYRAAEDALRDAQVPAYEGAEAMQEGLRQMGYDGITHIGGGRVGNSAIRHRVYIAFDPEQIKSATGNNGNFDPANPDIRFSRPMTADLFRQMTKPMKRGMSVTEVEKAIRSVVTSWKAGPGVRVVEKPSDLPMDAPADAKGAHTDGGPVYLVASNIGSQNEAMRVLAHEAVAHHGLRAMLGDDWGRLMKNIKLAIASGNVPLREIQTQVRQAYVDKDGKFNLDETQEADEVAAKVVEQAVDESGEFRPGFGFVKAFYAKIAEFLRSIGFTVKFTHTELQGMLVRAQSHLKVGERTAGVAAVTQPVFVRDAEKKPFAVGLNIEQSAVTRSASTFDEARKAAKAFQGQPLTNHQTGMVAQVSRNSLDKMLSTKAVHKSETPQSHSLAVANIDQLFERAILGWSKRDRDGDPSITAIHRMFAPVFHDGRAQMVKLTVKETARSDQPNPIYTVESVELNEKSPAAQWVDSTVQSDGIDPTSIRSAGEVHSLAQRIEDYNNRATGKVIITAKPETIQALRERHGELEADFQAATGYGFDSLTEPEARYLSKFKQAERVRDRIAEEVRRRGEKQDSPDAGGLNPDAGTQFARSQAEPELKGLDQAQPERPSPPEETRARAAQRVVQDQFNRFTVIRNWAKEQGVRLSQLSDVWGFEERMHGRIATRIEDFREQRVAPLVKKIQAAGFSMDQVAEFLHAQHAAERNSQIEKIDPTITDGSGMSTAEAAAILAKSAPDLAALANEFRAITDDTRQLLLQAGIISSEMAEAWTKAYTHYVPLKGGDRDTAPTGTGKGLSVKATNKRAMGHGSREEHIIENIMRDHERAVMLAEKNRVGHSLLAMVVELGREDIATFGQPEQRKVLKHSTQFEVVGRNGAVLGTFDSIGSANQFIVTQQRDGLTIRPVKGDAMVAYMASPMLADNEVQVYIKGHTLRIQLNDPLLARAYKKLGVEHLNKLLAANREINNFLSKAYTGFNPEFFIKNVLRDFTAGLINITGREGANIAVKAMGNYPKAFAQMLRYSFTNGKSVSPMIAEYRKHGGSTGAAYLSDIERIGADIKAAYEDYQGALALAKGGKYLPATRSAARKLLGLITGWMEHLNAAGENAMRVAVFESIRNTPGRSVEEAASAAKNATVNFNRKGEIGAQMGAMFLFFNAGVQGSAATLDALTTGKHRHQAQVLAGSMALLAYSMAAMQFGGDDDEWEKIADNVKDRNLVIRVGQGTYLTLAVPYGYGYFFTLGNALFDLQRGGDKDKIALNLASGLLEHFGPAINPLGGDEADAKGLIELMPGAVGGELMRAAGRLLVNRTSLGGEIVPDSKFDDGKPDSLRMQRRTSGTAYDTVAGTINQITGGTKSQAGMVDVSPETLRFWAETVTGGAGKFVMDAASLGALLAAQATEPKADRREALTPEIRELPIVRTVVRKADVRDSRRLYWESVAKAKSAQQDFARAKSMADVDGAQMVADKRGAWVSLADTVERANESVKAFRNAVADINASDDYTQAEKRMLIKEMEKGEGEVYAGMNDVFKGAAKRGE